MKQPFTGPLQVLALLIGGGGGAVAALCAAIAAGLDLWALVILLMGLAVGLYYAAAIGAAESKTGDRSRSILPLNDIFHILSAIWIRAELMSPLVKAGITFVITAVFWLPYFQVESVEESNVFARLLIPLILTTIAFGPRHGIASAFQAIIAYQYIAATEQFSFAIKSWFDLVQVILFAVAAMTFVLLCTLEILVELSHYDSLLRNKLKRIRQKI